MTLEKKLLVINIIITIADTLVCLAAVTTFGFAAIHFSRWWITLFGFVPLLLFNNHSLIINADLDAAEGDDSDA